MHPEPRNVLAESADLLPARAVTTGADGLGSRVLATQTNINFKLSSLSM